MDSYYSTLWKVSEMLAGEDKEGIWMGVVCVSVHLSL